MSNLNKEIVNEILERIKKDFLQEIRENNVELNIKPLRHAKLLDREEISLTESKVGGFPYIPIGERAPMFYDAFSDCEDDVQTATKMNKVVEGEILNAIEQYMWLHRRFKTRLNESDLNLYEA